MLESELNIDLKLDLTKSASKNTSPNGSMSKPLADIGIPFPHPMPESLPMTQTTGQFVDKLDENQQNFDTLRFYFSSKNSSFKLNEL